MVTGGTFFHLWGHVFSTFAVGGWTYVIVLVASTYLCLGSNKSWQIITHSQIVVFRKPWRRIFNALWICLPLCFCLWFGVNEAESTSLKSLGDVGAQITGVICVLVIGTVLVIISGVLVWGAAPETTVFDLSQGTFRYNRFWPGRRSHFTGSISEVQGIYVKCISSRGGTYYYVRIGWVKPGRPDVTLGIFTDETAARQEASRIEQMLRFGEQRGDPSAPASSAPWHHLLS